MADGLYLSIAEFAPSWADIHAGGMPAALLAGPAAPALDLRFGRYRPDTLIASLDDDGEGCGVCLVAFFPGDICADDIDLGICHAACLEGAPVVDLSTGEPTDGPVFTYRFDSLAQPQGGVQ